MKVFKHNDEVPDDAVNIEYMADHLWLIGSPDTVAGKIRSLYQDVGGFGGLLMLVYEPVGKQRGVGAFDPSAGRERHAAGVGFGPAPGQPETASGGNRLPSGAIFRPFLKIAPGCAPIA